MEKTTRKISVDFCSKIVLSLMYTTIYTFSSIELANAAHFSKRPGWKTQNRTFKSGEGSISRRSHSEGRADSILPANSANHFVAY